MISRSLMICLLGFLIAAAGKNADDYLHGANFHYVAGRIQEASTEVEEGIRNFPQEERLKTLAELLKKIKDQQRKDQNQNGGGESQKNDSSKTDKKRDKSESSAKDSADQKKDQQKQEAEKKQKEEENKKNQDQGDGKKDSTDQKKEGDSTASPPPKAGQMSKDEAERLLNSFADDEKKEQRERKLPKGRRPTVDQDW